MAIKFVERDIITDLIDQTMGLQHDHWEEVAKNKHIMVLAPDVAQYRRIEQAGRLFAILAYDGDEIVGYSVNLIGVNLHYKSLVQAQNDVLYVAPEHRAGRVGMRLIDQTKAAAAKRGARLMLWHAKEDTPLAGMLPRMGCKVQDIIFSQELPPSNFRFLGTFDVSGAAHEAVAAAHSTGKWDEFTVRQHAPGSAHHDTRCIVLRGPDVPDGTVYNLDVAHSVIPARDWVDNITFFPAVSSLCGQAFQRLGIKELGRVMLVELAPGGHIDAHHDGGAYAQHFDRFHLALTSDEGNEFTNGGESVHMRAGELWTFNHRIEHEVFNRSNKPRIHLIIDAVTE